MTDEIAFMSATRLISLYRGKKLSPVEVLAETLRRLERYEGAVNAFVLYDPEAAMAQARASEARWRQGEPQGLLDGVPVAIKDTVLTAGWPRLVGSRTIDPNQDVERGFAGHRGAAGAWRSVVRQDDDPRIRLEAFDQLAAFRRHPQPVGPQTHAGRQQRRQCCGGIGRHLSARGRHRRRRLDPHPGRVLRHLRVEADLWPGLGLPAFGVWRRCPCRADGAHRRGRRPDARAIKGPDSRDWHSLPDDGIAYRERVREGSLKGKRVALSPTLGLAEPEPAVRAAVERAAEVFRGLGAEVELADPFPQPPNGIFEPLALAAFWALLRALPPKAPAVMDRAS